MSKIRFRMVLAVMVTIVGLASVGYTQTNKLKFTSIDFPGAVLTAGRGINNYGEIAGSYRLPVKPCCSKRANSFRSHRPPGTRASAKLLASMIMGT